jgi:hypothetical protein
MDDSNTKTSGDDISENIMVYEEDIFLEKFGRLKYYLFNDLSIFDSLLKKAGKSLIVLSPGIEWVLNEGLSEKIKELMNKYNVLYSMTSYMEDNENIIILNKYIDDEWYFCNLNDVLKVEGSDD